MLVAPGPLPAREPEAPDSGAVKLRTPAPPGHTSPDIPAHMQQAGSTENRQSKNVLWLLLGHSSDSSKQSWAYKVHLSHLKNDTISNTLLGELSILLETYPENS